MSTTVNCFSVSPEFLWIFIFLKNSGFSRSTHSYSGVFFNFCFPFFLFFAQCRVVRVCRCCVVSVAGYLRQSRGGDLESLQEWVIRYQCFACFATAQGLQGYQVSSDVTLNNNHSRLKKKTQFLKISCKTSCKILQDNALFLQVGCSQEF